VSHMGFDSGLSIPQYGAFLLVSSLLLAASSKDKSHCLDEFTVSVNCFDEFIF
jgi:hypothetical protein